METKLQQVLDQIDKYLDLNDKAIPNQAEIEKIGNAIEAIRDDVTAMFKELKKYMGGV